MFSAGRSRPPQASNRRLAITKKGAIWTQSYIDPTKNTVENLPDYVLRLRFDEHFPTSTYQNRENKVNMTGLPIDYYELPTKNTVLHRISVAPDEDESVWFTELASDRLGTIKFRERVFTRKREKEEEDKCEEDGVNSKKKARTH